MSTQQVTVVATLKAKAGREEALLTELLALIPTTLKEEGCINYDLHRSRQNPTVFVFHETWTRQAALDAHLANTHLTAFMEKADDLLAEPPEIVLLEKVG